MMLKQLLVNFVRDFYTQNIRLIEAGVVNPERELGDECEEFSASVERCQPRVAKSFSGGARLCPLRRSSSEASRRREGFCS